MCQYQCQVPMGSKKDISPTKKASVQTLLRNTDYPMRKIARITGLAPSSIVKLKKSIHNGTLYRNKRIGPSGRKRITTPRDERKIRQVILNNRKSCVKVLASKLIVDSIHISPRTLRRRCYEMGFRCRRPRRKPKLTPAMREKRIKWAKAHKHFTVDDWNKVRYNILTNFIISY